MPLLAAAQRRHPEVKWVFVNQGEDRQAVERYLRKQDLELSTVLLDPTGRVGKHFGTRMLPVTAFFDASGNLVDHHLGALNRSLLREGMEEIGPANGGVSNR
jgi:thioredoxin-like negative regulator of GroEL